MIDVYKRQSNGRARANLSAEVTHNHPEGIKGAMATADSIFMCRYYFGGYCGDYETPIDDNPAECKRLIKEHIEQEYGYDLSRTLDGIRPTYRFNATCQDTVPQAIIAFLESTDFEDAIRNAISLGGCLLYTSSGVLTLGREAVSDYELFSAASVKAAAFARESTPPQARFLTADNHNNTIASLAGRDILCGSGSYLYFHGVDYAEAHAALRQLYEQPTNELLEQWGIDYVLIGAYERGGYAGEEDFYARSFPVVYDCLLYTSRCV